VVEDATTDSRFSSNPLVLQPPKIRFYAGAPLVSPSGHALGALCVVDTSPRNTPKPHELKILRALAAMVSDALEVARRTAISEEEEAVLALVGSLSGIGHWRYEVGADRLIWSEQLYALHGLDGDAAAVSMAWMQHLYVPEDRQILGLHLELARTSGEGFTIPLLHPRSDGALHQLTCKVAARRDMSGRVVCLLGVMQDVTAQRDTARRLNESEKRLRLFAEHSRDVLCHVGPEGRRLYVSPAASDMFGVSPEDMLHTDLLDGVHPDDRADLARLHLQLLGGAVDEGNVTYRVARAGAGPLCVELSAHTLRIADTGAANGYVAVLRDMSEREEAAEKLHAAQEYLLRAHAEMEQVSSDLAEARDRAERATHAKQHLVASLRHELRTPLTGILGYAKLLRQKAILDVQETAWLQTMLDAGAHLLATIATVQDVAAADRPAPQAEPVQLEDLLDHCIDLLRPAAELKGLRLSAAIAPDMPHDVGLDAARVRQIVLNFLDNAVTYTAEGAVTLRVSQGATGSLRFEVQDTGPGITGERRATLFSLGMPTEAGTAAGHGLGLSICLSLAEALGGEIGYLAAPEGGSLFWLEIPAQTTAQAATPPEAHMGVAGTIVRLPAHVLVVGEAAMNRDIIGAFLRSAGHHVSCASSGSEALSLAAAESFQVVLMDMHMPGMDGPETTRRLRALHCANARVPVIAMMQLPSPADIERYRAAGMDTHLPKPFTCPQLLDAVASALTLRHMQADRLGGAPSRAWPLIAPSTAQPEGDAPVCDTEMFDRTAAFLSRDDVRKHVKTLAARSEEILGQLRGPANTNTGQNDLLAAAHSVAGSAGMFGFQRLSQSARRYELAVVSDLPEREPATRGLVAAIETTLQDMQLRLAG
jgi:PAS domain S-box-containing protein